MRWGCVMYVCTYVCMYVCCERGGVTDFNIYPGWMLCVRERGVRFLLVGLRVEGFV